MLPLLVNERGILPIVIKKVNPFASFNFGDVQLLGILISLGRSTRLDFSLKAYKTSKTKNHIPYEWFNDPLEVYNTRILLRKPSCKLRSNIPLEKNHSDFHSLKDGGFTSKEALSKLKMKQAPATGQKNYQHLASVWQQENMRIFKGISRWYNNKNVVPTLKVMQKMFRFYHIKGIDIKKLGYPMPNYANICLHKSTNAKVFPFTESDEHLLEKISEDLVSGPSIVFTTKTVVDETFFRDSNNWCKTIVGDDVSQLYHFLMCEAMITGRYTRWELKLESG